jgi:hypothetical protein
MPRHTEREYAGAVKPPLAAALAAALVAALILASCGGSESGASTPTAGPGATATPASTAKQPPPRPASTRDYAPTVAAYLDEEATAFDTCLAALFAAWDMPYVNAGAGCRKGNTDDDEGDELVVAFTAPGDPQPLLFIAVFDVVRGAPETEWGAVYESPDFAFAPPTQGGIQPLIAAANLTAGGAAGGALAYGVPTCGAHTCQTTVHIVSGAGGGYRDLTPPTQALPEGGARIDSPDSIGFEDRDGDGAQELVLHGGVINSAGAGPQRPRTDVYRYDGAAYVLAGTIPDPPSYFYHAVVDADARAREQRYDEAADAYLGAVGNAALREWKDDRAELSAYALFRAAVMRAAAGAAADDVDAPLDRALAEFGATLHAQLAGAFRAAYAAKHDSAIACSAVNEDVQRNIDEYRAFWDYGYGNPPFDPQQVCPF